MGSILPKKATDRLTFLENRTADWSTNAVALGTTTTIITALTATVSAARAAYNAQQLAQAEAKVATQAWQDAARTMSRSASDVLKQIKAKAATGGNAIYNLALLPVPATPTAVPPPGTPNSFKVELNPDGSLQLKWKCPNPAGGVGTTYQISRRTGVTGEFIALGASGTRSFIDPTVPAGTPCVTYKIQAVRTTAVGLAAEFTVNFSVGAGSGEVMASVITAPRMAA